MAPPQVTTHTPQGYRQSMETTWRGEEVMIGALALIVVVPIVLIVVGFLLAGLQYLL